MRCRKRPLQPLLPIISSQTVGMWAVVQPYFAHSMMAKAGNKPGSLRMKLSVCRAKSQSILEGICSAYYAYQMMAVLVSIFQKMRGKGGSYFRSWPLRSMMWPGRFVIRHLSCFWQRTKACMSCPWGLTGHRCSWWLISRIKQ